MMKRLLCHILLLALLTPLALFGEELRIKLGAVHRISDTEDRVEATIDLREHIAIELEPNELIKGLEIKLEVPDKILSYRNSFLLTIYSGIEPPPETSRKEYRATIEHKQSFPEGKRLFIALPLAGDRKWSPKGPGMHVLSPPVSVETFPILIGIKPVMKGLPGEVSRTSYPVTVSPVLIDKGKLVLSAAPASMQNDAELQVDGQQLPADKREFLLSPGVHELKITSPATQPFSRTVVVEKGKKTVQELELEPASSKLSFEAPKDARIYLDGDEITDHRQAVETEPGEHLVLVRLGDYTMSKKITVRKGENYQVSLFFDILIEKD